MLLGLLAASLTLAACGQNTSGGGSVASSVDGGYAGDSANDTGVDKGLQYNYEPLAWESANKSERLQWSNYVFQVIDTEVFDNLNRATDATTFCPNYNQLNRDQRINFWGMLFAGIAYYESAWDPTSRMRETTMGSDPVTGQPVYSEGLLQLSYQDVEWAPYCEFDWNADRNLSSNSPQKTILDPYKNLSCGIKIMADQIDRTGRIVLSSGVYWATLRQGGSYQQIAGIAAMTRRLSFCR